MGVKDLFISDTMRERLDAMDKALRKSGFLAPSAPHLTDCEPFVRLVIHARGEDYHAGAVNRTISTQTQTIVVEVKRDDK